MITFFEANLLKLAIHHVGNPVFSEGYSLTDSEVDIAEDMKRQLLLHYFLSTFQKTADIYQFFHPSDNLAMNHSFRICKDIFDEHISFIYGSQILAKELFGATNHPNVKPGDLSVVLFENLQIEGQLLPAIGIFKSESKETYLKVNNGFGSADVEYEQNAVNINTLDKGCIIFNVDAANGYKVAVIDNTNKKDNSYWTDNFLQLKVRQDAYQDTTAVMGICKMFIMDKLDDEFEISNTKKIDLLNQTAKYFEQKETFDKDEFVNEVFGNDVAAESFNNFKEAYEAEFDFTIPDNFVISDTAVKKQSRSYKRVIKLDKNFQISVAGADSLIERGFDEDKGLNFYKVYFKQEVI